MGGHRLCPLPALLAALAVAALSAWLLARTLYTTSSGFVAPGALTNDW